jgi:hypothetical protein
VYAARVNALRYQTIVYVGAHRVSCIESYESVVESVRYCNEQSVADHWAPVELTIMGDEGRPLRAALAPAAISTIVAVEPKMQQEVNEA